MAYKASGGRRSVRPSPAQAATVERVMREFKEGTLEGSGGQPVTNPKQAIAIALREAGTSSRETPSANRKHFRHTKAREAEALEHGSRAELYEEARRRDIKGRSRMSVAELREALRT